MRRWPTSATLLRGRSVAVTSKLHLLGFGSIMLKTLTTHLRPALHHAHAVLIEGTSLPPLKPPPERAF